MFENNQALSENCIVLFHVYIKKSIVNRFSLAYDTNCRTEHILLINAVSQQYILTIRIDLIISDMILTRSSVTCKILVL